MHINGRNSFFDTPMCSLPKWMRTFAGCQLKKPAFSAEAAASDAENVVLGCELRGEFVVDVSRVSTAGAAAAFTKPLRGVGAHHRRASGRGCISDVCVPFASAGRSYLRNARFRAPAGIKRVAFTPDSFFCQLPGQSDLE